MFRLVWFIVLFAWVAPLAVRSQPMVANALVVETVLPIQGSASTRIVRGTGMLRGRELKIFVPHDPALRVLSPRCIGMFAEGLSLDPVRKEGGTLIGCVLPSGKTALLTGPVMKFTLEGGTPLFLR